MFSKKAQIGETMTWVFATIIIVIILAVSISLLSLPQFKNSKKLETKKIDSDFLVTKSFLGFLLTHETGGRIYDSLKDAKGYPTNPNHRFDDRIVSLAEEIFPVLYSEGVSDKKLWMGVVTKESVFGSGVLVSNEQFKLRNDMKSNDKSDWRSTYSFVELNNGNVFELLVKVKK